jgi:hypothetical protein
VAESTQNQAFVIEFFYKDVQTLKFSTDPLSALLSTRRLPLPPKTHLT